MTQECISRQRRSAFAGVERSSALPRIPGFRTPVQDPWSSWPPQAMLDETSCDCKLFPYLWPKLPNAKLCWFSSPPRQFGTGTNIHDTSLTKSYVSYFDDLIPMCVVDRLWQRCISCGWFSRFYPLVRNRQSSILFLWQLHTVDKKPCLPSVFTFCHLHLSHHQRGWLVVHVTFTGRGPRIHSSHRSLLFIHWTTNQLHSVSEPADRAPENNNQFKFKVSSTYLCIPWHLLKRRKIMQLIYIWDI